MDDTELHYPDLANCAIETTSGTALTNESIVKLPQDCVAALRKPLPSLYEFSVERSIIRKKKERGQNGSSSSSTSTTTTTTNSSDEVQATSAHSSSDGSTSSSSDKNAVVDETDLEKSILVKMKSVTGADDDVCVALLKQNSYDLETSIETFFQSHMR